MNTQSLLGTVADLQRWRHKLAEEPPVAYSEAPRSIDFNRILVMVANFHDGARVIPLSGVRTTLVLNESTITYCEFREGSSMFVQYLCRSGISHFHGIFLTFPCFSPRRPDGRVIKLLKPVNKGERIAKWSAKDDFSRGDVTVRVWCISDL